MAKEKFVNSSIENFTGEFVIGEKGLQKDVMLAGGRWNMSNLRFMLRGNGNTAFLRASGIAEYANGKKVVKPFTFKDNNDEEIKIPYENRFDEEELKKVPFYMKRTIKIGDVYKSFLDSEEWIDFLAEELPKHNGKYIRVKSGEISHTPGENGIFTEFTPTYMEILEDVPAVTIFKGTEQLYMSREMVDQDLWKNGKPDVKYIMEDLGGKVVFTAYSKVKNKSKASKDSIKEYLLPQTYTMDFRKLDLTNEKHQNMLAAMLNMIKVTKKGFYTIAVYTSYINGKEEKQYTDEELLSMLPEEQLELLKTWPELKDGLIREAMGRPQVGERTRETRLVSPNPRIPLLTEVEWLDETMLTLYKLVQQKDQEAKAAKGGASKAAVKAEIPKPKKEDDVKVDEFESLFA